MIRDHDHHHPRARHFFDAAATGQGLLNYFLRAFNCGAVSEGEVGVRGRALDELRLRSIARILAARRARLSGGAP